jgi:thiol-disulfide isomerase/thioredoxin
MALPKSLALLLIPALACRNAPAARTTEPLARPPIPWLHDDYAAARKLALDKKKPLVIDMWAPWCHTCLSMQQTVLADPSVRALHDRFVWLAVDTDRERNAEVAGRFPVNAWPTFFVVSADDHNVESRLVGSATVREFREFLEQGEGLWRESRGDGGLDEALHHVRDGDRAATARDWRAADAAYTRALDGDLGDRLPDVLVAAIGARSKAGEWARCVELGRARLADAARARSAKAADFAAYADLCADKLDGAASVALRRAIVAGDSPVRAVLMDPASPLSVDDRSDGLRILREVHDALGDKDAGTALAERQRALLLEAIERAPDARAAMTFNWPLAEASVRLGRPGDAIPVVARSVDALPDEYDPPHRLAWLLLMAGRPGEALPWADKSLGLAYGPRKARVQTLVADVHAALGDVEAERAARAAVVAILEALPAPQQNPPALDDARAALAKVGVPAR